MDRRLTDDLAFLAALVASAALFYLSGFHGLLPLAFAALAVFAVLAFFRIHLALPAIIVFLPYFMAPVKVGHHPWPPDEWLMIAVGVAAAAIIAMSWFGLTRPHNEAESRKFWTLPVGPNWRPLTKSPFLLPGFIFLLAAFTSAMHAAELGLAARDFLEVVVEPMAFFGLLLLFTPLETPSRRERSLLLIGIVVVAAGVVPSFIALYQLVTNHNLVTVSNASYTRVIGPYAGPDNFGLLLDRTIPMALALLLVSALFLGTRGDTHRPGGRGLIAYRGLIGIAFAVMVAALIFTFVLGAWLGTAIAAVLLLLVRFRHGWWLVAAATLILVAGVALGSGKAHAITGGRRLLIWQSAIHMIVDNPILGIGPDNFQHYYTPRHGDGVSLKARNPAGRCSHGLGYMVKTPAAENEPCFSHPHNLILDLWLSTGIVGLAAFIWLQVVFWSILWTRRTALTLSPVFLGAGGAMVASLLHGMVDNGYFLIDLSALMWLLFGVASMFATATTDPPVSVPTTSTTPVHSS